MTSSALAPLPNRAYRPVGARLRSAPLLEPPYDDELGEQPSLRLVADRLPFEQPLLPVPSQPGPPMLLGTAPTALRRAPGDRTGGPADVRPAPAAAHLPGLPGQTSRDERLPDPRAWAGRFVVALFEALSGRRPMAQLMPWTDPRLYAELARRQRTGQPLPPTTVRSVHVSEPSDGVAEVCAVVRRDGRCRAVAVRLESNGGRWRCTVLQMG